MKVESGKKSFADDLKYYLPRWLLFGVVAGLIGGGPVVSPNADGTMPEGYFWHVVLWQDLPIGIVYGLLAGVLFVGLQRLWNSNGSRIKWWVNLFGSMFIVKLALVGVNNVVPQVQPNVLSEMEIRAKTDYPNSTYTAGTKQEALRQSAEFLARSEDQEKIEGAAGQFIGFYALNARIRPTYCQGLGVDVSSFTKAFKNANEDVYKKAILVMNRTYVTEEQVFEQVQSQLGDFNRKNMMDVAASQKMTTSQLCQQFRDNPEGRIEQETFSRVNPAAYQLLMNAP
jgi:hypothetical protein